MNRRGVYIRGQDSVARGRVERARNARHPSPPCSNRLQGNGDHQYQSSPQDASQSPRRREHDQFNAAYCSKPRARVSIRTYPEEPRLLERECRYSKDPPLSSPRALTRGPLPNTDLPGSYLEGNGARKLNRSSNDTRGSRVPMQFTSNSGVGGVENLLNTGLVSSSRSSYGILMPQPTVLDDGTFRTFYVLPPDPSQTFSSDDGIPKKLNMLSPPNSTEAGYLDVIGRYGTDHRQPQGEGLHQREPIRSGFTNGNNPGLVHSRRPNNEPFFLRVRGPSEYQHANAGLDLSSASHRRSPPSPYRDSVELRSRRRGSRSPVQYKSPVHDRFNQKLRSPTREGVESPFINHGARTGLVDGPDISRIGRVASPSKRCGPYEDASITRVRTPYQETHANEGPINSRVSSPSKRGDPYVGASITRVRIPYKETHATEGPIRVPVDTSISLQREVPTMYNPATRVIHQREALPANFLREFSLPKDGASSRQRLAQIGPYMEDPMYGQVRSTTTRASRSPQWETVVEPYSDGHFTGRVVDKLGMVGHVSPRRTPYPNLNSRMRVHEPTLKDLDLSNTGIRALKRKSIEPPEDVLEAGRRSRTDKSEFKRQERERGHDPFQGFPSRRFGRLLMSTDVLLRPERSYRHSGRHLSGPEREEYGHSRGHDSEHRLTGGGHDFEQRLRGISPLKKVRRSTLHSEGYMRVKDLDFTDDRCQFEDEASRFSEFPSVYSEQSRSWQGHDVQVDLIPKVDGKISAPDHLENSEEFKQRIHRAFLKFAKALNENAGQRKRYEDQGKAGTLLCLACSRLSKTFSDTHSLVVHTYNSKKGGMRAEHLGLHKALCTLMGWRIAVEPDNNRAYQRILPEEAKAAKEDLILWPPVVVIHNALTGKRSDGQQEGIGNPEMDELFEEVGRSKEKAKAVHKRQGHKDILIVKYLATFSGLKEAECIHQHFETTGRGRNDWLHVQPSFGEEYPDLVQIDEKTKEKKRVLYGYLALASDLDKVDVETRRRCLIRSRKEIEAILDDFRV